MDDLNTREAPNREKGEGRSRVAKHRLQADGQEQPVDELASMEALNRKKGRGGVGKQSIDIRQMARNRTSQWMT